MVIEHSCSKLLTRGIKVIMTLFRRSLQSCTNVFYFLVFTRSIESFDDARRPIKRIIVKYHLKYSNESLILVFNPEKVFYTLKIHLTAFFTPSKIQLLVICMQDKNLPV